MIKLKTFKVDKNLLETFFITFIIWLSLGTKYKYNAEFFSIDFINNLRFFAPFGLVFFIFYFKKKNASLNMLDFFVFLIFCSFLIGFYNLYFLNENNLILFKHDRLLIHLGYLPDKFKDFFLCLFFVITFLFLSRFNYKELSNFYKISFFFLILSTSLTLFFSYKEFIFSNKGYLYFTHFLVEGELMGVPTIRSLGLSRNLLILSIPLTLIFIFSNNFKYKNLITIILVFLLFNLFQLQSRTTIYSLYIISSALILFLVYKKEYKNIIRFLVFLILIPQILNFSVPLIKDYFMEEMDIQRMDSRVFSLTPNNPDIIIKQSQKKLAIEMLSRSSSGKEVEKYKKELEKEYNYEVLQEFTSGRLELWKNVYSLFSKDNNFNYKFLGFGPAADRYFIKESLSNSTLYSLISGGLIGVFSIILFYFYILFQLLKFFLKKKYISENILEYSCAITILYLLLRSLVENSFIIFGTDHIFLFSCLMIIKIRNDVKN